MTSICKPGNPGDAPSPGNEGGGEWDFKWRRRAVPLEIATDYQPLVLPGTWFFVPESEQVMNKVPTAGMLVVQV